MSCCKCPEPTWIELDGEKYCHRHGEVQLAHARIAKERALQSVPEPSPTDRAFVAKIKYQGAWVTVKGHLVSMELDTPKPQQIASMTGKMMTIPSLNEMLTLKIAPTEVRRWKYEPEGL